MKRRPAARLIDVKLRRLDHAEGLPLPAYQTGEAAGFDLLAAIPKDRPLTIRPRARVLIPTGLIFELPAGFEAQIRPRSGLAAKFGVTVLNSPGTIDADYRGEVSVILINLADTPFLINRGDRIAQMIVSPVTRVRLQEEKSLSATARGTRGFGSTGIDATSSSQEATKENAIAKSRKRAQSKTRRSPKPRTR